jgi:hypothetical protein
MLLLCLMMCFMPASAYCSVDTKRKPGIKSVTCPLGILHVLLHKRPSFISMPPLANSIPTGFLANLSVCNLPGLTTRRNYRARLCKWIFQLLIVYGGVLFDMLIVPLLIWKKTAIMHLFCFVAFHLFNSIVFNIGIFPYLSIALAIFSLIRKKIRPILFKNKPIVDHHSVQSIPVRV